MSNTDKRHQVVAKVRRWLKPAPRRRQMAVEAAERRAQAVQEAMERRAQFRE